MLCTCGRIAIGSQITEHRNWHPDCPEHGLESVWWNSPEQQQKRAEQNDRLRYLQQRARELQQQAREAREARKQTDGE